jgi:hypothetical protein
MVSVAYVVVVFVPPQLEPDGGLPQVCDGNV